MRKTIPCFLALASIAACTASTALAVNLSATPSVSMEGSWDSNVFNAPSDEQDDYVFRARPKLVLGIETPETTVSVGAGLEYERFAHNKQLDTDPPSLFFSLDAAGPVKLTERLSITPSGRFVQTNDTTRRRELVSGVEGAPPAESTITRRSKTRDYGGGLRANYRVSPLSAVSLGGAVSKREFPDAESGLAGSKSIKGDGTWSYTLSPRTTAGIYVSAGNSSFEGRRDSEVYSGSLSTTYRSSERTSLTANVGAALLRQPAVQFDLDAFLRREPIVFTNETKEIWAPSGNLTLTYAAGTFRAALGAGYSLVGEGSFGVGTRRFDGSLSLTGMLSERLSWVLGAAGQTNRSTDDFKIVNTVTLGGDAGISYAAAKWATVKLAGKTDIQDSRSPLADDVTRHSVFVTVTLSDSYRLF